MSKKRWCAAAVLVFITAAVAAQAPSQWIDVPFVRQSPEGCGAASIAMVMRYWSQHSGASLGRAEDAAYIFDQLHLPNTKGIYASQLESYLQAHGFRTFAFHGTWDDLKQHIAKGRPLIVALRPPRNDDSLHYVVVAGVDDAQQLVMFNDPADRKLAKLDRKSFEKEWKATEQWTLLAVPQSSAH
jgi:ABC-type bacteriocin/lantibiotic exporter with double-glycine peptidase domain